MIHCCQNWKLESTRKMQSYDWMLIADCEKVRFVLLQLRIQSNQQSKTISQKKTRQIKSQEGFPHISSADITCNGLVPTRKKVCCLEKTRKYERICKDCMLYTFRFTRYQIPLTLLVSYLFCALYIDVNSDDLCSNSVAIFCCANQLEEASGDEGFHFWSVCLNGDSLIRQKLRNSNRNAKKKDEQIKDQAIQPSQALVEFPITSDELQCPKISKGVIMKRIFKVCCQRPWENTSWLRKCKDCKPDIFLCEF